MDQISKAYEHIKVILGVSGGVLSMGHLQTIFRRYQLDGAQQAAVMDRLAEIGVGPMPEEDSPQPQQAPVSIRSPGWKRGYTPEQRQQHLNRVRQAYLEHTGENPGLPEQYQAEIPVLKAAVAQEAADGAQRRPEKILSRAVMRIGHYRARKYRKEGWVCGTHSSRGRELLEGWLCWLCSDEELTALVRYCEDPTGAEDSYFEELLLLLLNNTPRIIVHRRLSAEYSD